MSVPSFRSSIDDVIEIYKKDVDVSLIRENLKLTPTERLMKLQEYVNFLCEVQRAGKDARQSKVDKKP